MVGLTRHSVAGNGCWIFSGKPGKDGYGKLKIQSKTIRAHRHYYAVHVGPIPKGLWVLHKCDNPICVNPAHLYIGTQIDNERDKDARGRRPPSPSIAHPESLPRGEKHHRFLQRYAKESRRSVARRKQRPSVGCNAQRKTIAANRGTGARNTRR